MITTRKIRGDEYDALYSHMKRDFPANEIAPFFAIKRNFENNVYNGLYLIHPDEKDIGYAVITAPESLNLVLINYFAIFPEYRSKGYGSEFLKIIISSYPDSNIFIEADDPSAAKTEARRDESIRRVKFYERAGFNIIPTKKAKIFGVDMVIMSTGAAIGARNAMRALYLPALGKQWLRFIDVRDYDN